MKNILKVRMLGGFTLEYKGKELVLDRNNVSKTTQLFQLLLLHTQDGGISKAAHRSGASGKQLHQYKWWNVYLGPGYRNFSRRMRLQADDRISTSRKIPKDQNGNLRQSMETLYRRIPPGYDGRGLGGSRKHRMSRYVFRLCRRTVPLPENRRKIRRTLPCCTQRSRNLSILRLADMGNRQPHRNVPLQRRPRCLQKNNQADVRRTRPVTIRRNARAIQTHGRANLTGSRRNRRHQVPPPRKRIHRRRLLLHLSKLCGRLPRVRPHDGTNRHVRIPDALHPELYKYRDRRRKSEILFRTSPRVHSESSP